MAQSSVDVVLQELRGDIDASFAEHRRLLENASNAFRRRSRMPLQRSETPKAPSTVHGFGRHNRDSDRESQQHHLRYGGGAASSGVQWDAFDVLLASIDTSQPSRSPTVHAHRIQHHRFQYSRLHERSLLRTQLVILASECEQMAPRKREAAPLSPEEQGNLMRRCFSGWQERAREKTKQGSLIAGAKRQLQRVLLCNTFRLWGSWCVKQRRFSVLSEQVARSANAVALRSAYRTWRRALHKRITTRKLRNTYQRTQTRFALTMWKQNARRQLQMRLWRRERHYKLCFQVIQAWHSATVNKKWKNCMQQSAQSFWRRRTQANVFARLQRGVHLRAEIALLKLRHAHNTQHKCFLDWCEFLERKKRYRFAAAWSNQNQCARTFDHWNAVLLRRKRNARVTQSFKRRSQRNVVKNAFAAWTSLAQVVRNQRLAILVSASSAIRLNTVLCDDSGSLFVHAQKCVYRRKVRACFAHLCGISRGFAGREAAFLQKKARQAVWKWYHSTQDAIAINKKTAIVAKRESIRILRDIGWKRWRTLYLLMVKKQEFEARWRHQYTKRVWRVFTRAVGHKQRANALNLKAVAQFQQQLHKRVFESWVKHFAITRERRGQVAIADRLFRVNALKRVFFALKDYQSDALSNQVADSFFIRRVFKMWRMGVELSKQQCAVRVERVSKLVRRIVLREFFDLLKRFVHARRRELCLWVFAVWEELPRMNQARSLLAHLGRKTRTRRVWSSWIDQVQYAKQLRASAKLVRRRREESLKRFYLVDLWRDKAVNYRLAFRKLESIERSVILNSSLKLWRQLKHDKDLERRADKVCVRSMKRKSFHQLMRMVADSKSRIREWKRRKLSVYWKAWSRFLQRRMVLYNAARHHKTFRMQRAMSKLLACAHHGAKTHQQREIADSWHVAVVMLRVFTAWQAFSAKQADSRQRARLIEWRIVGRKAWRRWRKSLIQEQHVRVLQNMVSRNVLMQTWNAMVQVTKRRQVAKTMWRYTMVSVRLSKCLHSWQQHLKMCKAQQQRVDTLVQEMNKIRLKQFFAGWTQFVVIRAFSVIRKQREKKRYARNCWRSWTRYYQLQRLRHKSDVKLMRRVFIFGLQRNAFYRQASREARFRNETLLLQRVLKQWRVEMWLRISQRSIKHEQKESVLRRWLQFVAQRQQKRKLTEYAKQLHRLHESNDAVRSNRRRRVFREACVLQTQVDRQRRQTKREVFEAWHLAAKSAQRTRFKQFGSTRLVVELRDSLGDQENLTPNRAERIGLQGYRHRSKGSHGRDQSPQVASKKGKNQVALEFWSGRLVSTCFYMWRHLHRSTTSGKL